MGEDTVVVRPAKTSDAQELRRLSVGFTTSAELLDEGEFRRRCSELIADGDWFLAVAEAGGATVGYVAAQDFGPGLRATCTTGRIHDLYVEPGTRRRGAGRSLMTGSSTEHVGAPTP